MERERESFSNRAAIGKSFLKTTCSALFSLLFLRWRAWSSLA
jgi:hypothetical protein